MAETYPLSAPPLTTHTSCATMHGPPYEQLRPGQISEMANGWKLLLRSALESLLRWERAEKPMGRILWARPAVVYISAQVQKIGKYSLMTPSLSPHSHLATPKCRRGRATSRDRVTKQPVCLHPAFVSSATLTFGRKGMGSSAALQPRSPARRLVGHQKEFCL